MIVYARRHLCGPLNQILKPESETTRAKQKAVNMRLPMLRAVILAGAITVVAESAVLAATLTGNDYRFLENEYGLRSDSETIRDLSADEQAKLHDLINDSTWKAYPLVRNENVAEFLYHAHLRECYVWSLAHTTPECPPTSDASAEPGKEIADRQCNTCHLFGAVDAPSFFKLAEEGKPNEQSLVDALNHGHQMSPITLQPAQIRDLIVYIRSLK